MGSQSLSDELAGTLVSLVNLIIPSNADRGLPAAADVGCAEYLQNQEDLAWVRDGIAILAEASRDQFGREFRSLATAEQEQLVHGLRRRLTRFYIRLSQRVAERYYQDDQVLESIGLPARPPFPEGYLVDEGDLTLLEPVFERGEIYRD